MFGNIDLSKIALAHDLKFVKYLENSFVLLANCFCNTDLISLICAQLFIFIAFNLLNSFILSSNKSLELFGIVCHLPGFQNILGQVITYDTHHVFCMFTIYFVEVCCEFAVKTFCAKS